MPRNRSHRVYLGFQFREPPSSSPRLCNSFLSLSAAANPNFSPLLHVWVLFLFLENIVFHSEDATDAVACHVHAPPAWKHYRGESGEEGKEGCVAVGSPPYSPNATALSHPTKPPPPLTRSRVKPSQPRVPLPRPPPMALRPSMVDCAPVMLLFYALLQVGGMVVGGAVACGAVGA
ncbi:hypothetical protein DEO72_LG2g4556 [Vigna unguiculata]|uniref:Uncharacterized protein n=1 Tax=Vigna unguiculata TaxID=3917 RepID=A0A4D6L6U5_VIGUN|nr:hypothetical protein DEO72_LG2g4556 [Vigna unguiculata]